MNYKLQLCTLLASLLTIVNSLAIDNEIDDIQLNNPNAKYSKKLSSTTSNAGSKIANGSKKILKWILIIGIIIITILIITCICCCLGICTCCGMGSSGKKEKYETNNTNVNTSRPYGSEPEVVTVAPGPQNSPQPPPQAYNPVYPSYGNQPGAYPQQGSYPPPGAPYGQPLYPNVQ